MNNDEIFMAGKISIIVKYKHRTNAINKINFIYNNLKKKQFYF